MGRTILSCTIVFFVFAASAAAQHGGGAKPHGSQAPKPTVAHGGGHATQPAGGSAKPHGTSGSHGSPKATTTHSTKAPKPKTKTTTVSAKSTTKPAKAGKTTTTTTATTTLTPVQLKLQKNTQLASKLQTRLGGLDPQLAAVGFRNLGQFVAAVNVSNNLGIPFAELKTRMVDQGMSLGQAIQDSPRTTTTTTSTSVIVARAEREADEMIRSTETANKTKPKSKPKKTHTTAGGQK
jgi:hypothetical protein